jgi:hypothetical protein
VSDLLVIVVIAAFFRLCLGYVRLCDRIIGPDQDGALPVVISHGEAVQADAAREQASVMS